MTLVKCSRTVLVYRRRVGGGARGRLWGGAVGGERPMQGNNLEGREEYLEQSSVKVWDGKSGEVRGGAPFYKLWDTVLLLCDI